MFVIVMGVSGSGKTTIGKGLAERLGYRFYEGDDFHTAGNVAKMAAGIPLTDEDRGGVTVGSDGNQEAAISKQY